MTDAREIRVLGDQLPAPTPCKSCGATIVFRKTLAGKWMPLETTLEPLRTERQGEQSILVFSADAAHWAKCPHAQAWRKR